MLAMPRRASWAARTVPDAPRPTFATAVRRSDFVVRPVLRVRRACLALSHMVIHACDHLARGLGKDAGHDGVNQASSTSADQFCPDQNRACAVRRPAHA